MKNMYKTEIYWSEQDECFVAKVPALKGCISHGDTFTEAADNIQEAARLWLLAAKKLRETPPEPDLAVEEMYRFSPVLNVSKLARLSGVNRSTLVSKLRRRTRFTKSESNRLLKVLRSL